MGVSSILVKCKFSADAVDAVFQPSLGHKLDGFCVVKYNDLDILGYWK